jgi:uncharacterized protein YndB with AHSA1/START domain
VSEPYNWSRFVTRIAVKASLTTLYNAWATRAGIENWFLRMSEYKKPDENLRVHNEAVQKGDTYTWRWYGWSDETTEYGSILDCNGKDFFKFSFGKAGNCSVTIKEEEGQNIVELVQDNIPTDEQGRHYWHLGCKTGWTFYLANLKSILEGGIDLRNKDERLTNVINA